MSTESQVTGWPEGVGRIVLDEIDSTNAEAARRADTTAKPTWILAHRQTSGRGRRGRPWADPVGNFSASHLMFPDEALKDVALNSFIAAVSLYQALKELVPSDGYALKWPNDVLLNGTKIAGILLESSGTRDKVNWLVIGIGVNLTHAPAIIDVEPRATPPSSVVAQLGKAPSAEELLSLLAIKFAANRQLYLSEGFNAIRLLWLRHAANLGAAITARTMRDEIAGTFEDIDNEGNLILATSKGSVAITAADVFF
ncbi:MAG: biotin--[acetyl-CoA-carboxylase] ligase [Sulfitobacter sp.]